MEGNSWYGMNNVWTAMPLSPKKGNPLEKKRYRWLFNRIWRIYANEMANWLHPAVVDPAVAAASSQAGRPAAPEEDTMARKD